MRFKWLDAYYPSQRRRPLFSVSWERGKWGRKSTDGRYLPYSYRVTVATRAKWFYYHREYGVWRLAILGIEVSHHWSAGGRFS